MFVKQPLSRLCPIIIGRIYNISYLNRVKALFAALWLIEVNKNANTLNILNLSGLKTDIITGGKNAFTAVMMQRDVMKKRHKKTERKGAVLLVVLIIVLVIAIISSGYLVKSDVQLACGDNMITLSRISYLAESGLEHAKGLILNPQDTSGDYWQGASGLQISTDTNDFYDVTVSKSSSRNYLITSSAYNERQGRHTANKTLSAELRLDPYLAYWQHKNIILPQVTIYGDAYCDDTLMNCGKIYGDVYCYKNLISVSGSYVQGSVNQYNSSPVSPPGVTYATYGPTYYYNGSGPYSAAILSSDTYDSTFPSAGFNNPASVYYRDGDLKLKGSITINGTLIVKHDLRLDTNANITVTAQKNMPALIVDHDLDIDAWSVHLTAEGYVQIGHDLDLNNKTSCSINVSGALYILTGDLKNISSSSVTVTSNLEKAALEIWWSAASVTRWSPAAGAFYKSISSP